ncbi:hypothetical protein GWI33_016532 [Rhynchophorus ferrugineus]|uniref:Uncharacterized protein n=1 Tax=Rhynchophorus ferrugineus TaxID=354439 RepID=A0A834MA61_RHYFE|nr:hypothetical protein GWI33_016532 [Rhynchophorus ferrugineus]
MCDSCEDSKKFKIIVIGDPECGKTSLLVRYTLGTFLRDAITTIGVDIQTKTLTINNQKITLQFWDTAGQEKYRRCLVKHFYRGADAIVFVYDVSNSRSYDSIIRWLNEARLYCMPDAIKVLVGNKCDKIATVRKREAEKFARAHDMMLFETSAKCHLLGDKVDSVFLYIANVLSMQNTPKSGFGTIKITLDKEENNKRSRKERWSKKCC